MTSYEGWLKKRSGTSFRGYLLASYRDIVGAYGKPHDTPDNDKIDAEWVVNTPYGVATIYNYKDGKAYLGDKGLPVEQIFEWHVGGKNGKVLGHVKMQIVNHVIQRLG